MDLSSRVIIVLLFMLVVMVALWLFVYPVWRRKQLDSKPFPDNWEEIVKTRLPFYPRMPVEMQRTLQNRITHFVAGKRFEGCAGQVIDDNVRVSIAAQACLLVLSRPGDYYSDLHTILVYPSGFIVRHGSVDDHGLVSDEEHVLAGESWNNGRIVLSWDDVERGASDFSDGFNVVLHEFAHQLDHQSGATNGAPLLASRQAYQNWASVFSEEFDRLQALASSPDFHHAHDEVLDLYGATNPAEFFAVATEAFFERSGLLAQRHPQLFAQLYEYYGIDPRDWF
ncbi:MAG: M90 family metallopeptidase [Pseudohongiella sp.]|uniref:zinc-dependent peptidase n=1 Tax=Pseudohongiella sp. TaxID=1979412 RepID=UPI0034A08950